MKSGNRLALAAVVLFVLLGARASAQALYALNGDGTVGKIAPSGVVTTIVLDGGSPSPAECLAIDTAGNLYVSYDDNTIGKFDAAGNALPFPLSGDSLDTPAGLAFDAFGNLYVANVNNNTISKISPAGVVSTFATGNGLDAPWRLAFDAAGNLYGASLNGPFISKFDDAGNPLPFPALSGGGLTEFNGLGGMAFDSQGALFATNANFNTIVKIDQTTGAATLFATGSQPFDVLVGLAIDALGNFYAAELNGNTVDKFDAAGNVVPFPLSGDSLQAPFDVAFAPAATTAAPEGSTLGLMALGLPGAIGFAFRWRGGTAPGSFLRRFL